MLQLIEEDKAEKTKLWNCLKQFSYSQIKILYAKMETLIFATNNQHKVDEIKYGVGQPIYNYYIKRSRNRY